MKLVLLILSIFSLQYLSAEINNKEKVLKNHQLINILMGEEVFIEKTISPNRLARASRESRPTRAARLTRESRNSRTMHLVQETLPSKVIEIQAKEKSFLKATINTKPESIKLVKKK